MANEPRKHHYIPRSVLRNFSIAGDQRSVFVFDKTSGRSFASPIGDAGAERNFYSVDIGDRHINFEPLFQSLDDRLASLVAMLTSTPSLEALDAVDRYDLAAVTACQLLRTKMQRTSPLDLARQLSQRARESGLDVPEEKADEQKTRLGSLERLIALDEIAGVLATKDMILVRTPCPCLWTSDNPVTLYNVFPYGRPALKAPGVEIYHPISPQLCLGFMCRSLGEILAESLDPEHPRPATNNPQMVRLLASIRDGVPLEGDTNYSTYLNELQIRNSSRFLYGSRDDFSLAQEVIAHNPTLRNVRTLVTVGKMGTWLPPNPEMPPGTWLVVESGYRHHIIPVTIVADDSWALAFTTTDETKLALMNRDSPFDSVTLYRDGHALRMIRGVVFQYVHGDGTRYVRVQHADANDNALAERIHQERS